MESQYRGKRNRRRELSYNKGKLPSGAVWGVLIIGLALLANQRGSWSWPSDAQEVQARGNKAARSGAVVRADDDLMQKLQSPRPAAYLENADFQPLFGGMKKELKLRLRKEDFDGRLGD